MIDSHLAAPKAPRSRKLAAIVYADVAGYSRLIGLDDVGTMRRLQELRDRVVEPGLHRHSGALINTAGDALLMVFESALDAVLFAIDLQRQIVVHDRTELANRKIRFRVGIAIGDVIGAGADSHGEGINIAARLEALCPPGEICVTRTVWEQVHSRVALPARPLGALRLKNIVHMVEAFVIELASEPALTMPEAATIAAPVGVAPLLQSRPPSIAVLPFRGIGPRRPQRYFGEGLAHHIVGALSAFHELFVISSSSTLSLSSDSAEAVRSAAGLLGVRYIVTGAIANRDRHLHVTVELTDTETHSVIWSDRCETGGADLFAAQDLLATRIAYSLLPRLRRSELQRALRKPPSDMDAYELVLQAQHRLYRLNDADRQAARALLLQAVERDPAYAMAYALLAHWHVFQVAEGRTQDLKTDQQLAARFSANALDLDPSDPLALAVHGHATAFLFKKLDTAVEIFDRAIASSPNSPIAWAMSSPVYAYLGDGPTAVARAEYALRLSPLDPYAHIFQGRLGFAHFVNGNFPEAIDWTRRALAKEPRYIGPLRPLIAALAAMDRLAEAREAASQLMALRPEFRVDWFISQYPITDKELAARYRAWLLAAGLPE